jgi:hypothetical protein
MREKQHASSRVSGGALLERELEVAGKPTPECRLLPLGARARRMDPVALSYLETREEATPCMAPLTQQEAGASVARRVRGGEAQGLDRAQAIRRTSVETGIDPGKVRWCVETVIGAAPVRLSPALSRRRGAWAIAAAL